MKTEFKHSHLHGNGIFATKDIQENEIIDVYPVLVLDEKDAQVIDHTILHDYYYSWKDGAAIALGYGSLLNHSYAPNAFYRKDFGENTLTIIALKNIPKGAEITINYNGDPQDQEQVWFEQVLNLV